MEKIKEVQDENIDIIPIVTEHIKDQLKEKVDQILIESLRRKGYTFNNRLELFIFIKENITVDVVNLNEKIYYINGHPFLLFIEGEKGVRCDPINGVYSCDIGVYKYL